MNPDVKIIQGQFRLHSVNVVTSTKDLLILEIDCYSKYPGHFSVVWSGDERGIRVDIWPADRTLYLDEEAPQEVTSVELPPHTHNWTVLTDGRKHSVKIVAYRHHGRRTREIWRVK